MTTMKFLLCIVVVGEILTMILKALSKISLTYNRKETSASQARRDWYGVCDNCGKTDGLHRLDGKRYCAMCHAKIKTERDFAKKQQNGE